MASNAKIATTSLVVLTATSLYPTLKLMKFNISNAIFAITNTMPFQLALNAKAITSNQPILA
jgi:hypothetical protein